MLPNPTAILNARKLASLESLIFDGEIILISISIALSLDLWFLFNPGKHEKLFEKVG